MAETPEKRSYKSTLNLPKTHFAMKADLVQKEPVMLRRWQETDLYQQIRTARAGSPRFAFHDGPPYANGAIHIGHLLNKVLKDMVVRSRTMAGLDVPYVPGWDCHGQPIEHKILAELGDKATDMRAGQIRRRCRESAEKFIKLQKTQMQRLLTLADYDHPYITMDPAFEAATLEVFAALVDKGLVYRALKPVHWSIANRTALAEAELEYEDRTDTSVYVLFQVKQPEALGRVMGLPADAEPASLMIWTTTPWTLPANLAVAVNPTHAYGLYQFTKAGHRVRAVLATRLAEKVLAMAGATDVQTLGQCTGQALADAGLTYQHPFIDRTGTLVLADYVTLDDGTGLVHTAPGHGTEDYQTGRRYNLPIYCPVRADGTFDETAPDWLREPGVDVWKANGLVIERLRDSGHLVHDHTFVHSYPHDWRGKSPVIFRATYQWFIHVDQPFTPPGSATAPGSAPGPAPGPGSHSGSGTAGAPCVDGPALSLRDRAVQAAQTQIAFIPDWGRNRMRGMLESRPDWCISRQRHWGLPIPAFFEPGPDGTAGNQDTDKFLLTQQSIQAVADKLREHGADYWFSATTQELLSEYAPEADPDLPQWLKDKLAVRGRMEGVHRLVKSNDIFDVWFESGSSWHAVMQQRGLAQPNGQMDLYLEGSDQHRGWFQSSLLPALGVMGCAPFKAVLTHGFIVDKDGRKMSKSLGNTVEVESLLKEFGADICRWWVSSVNTENDIKVDMAFFRLAGEEYRKVRNTIRFLLSNLYDFDPANAHCFTQADATSLDAWVLGELAALETQVADPVNGAYARYDFRQAHEAIFDFCNQTLSAVYLAATKDRLYCDKPDSTRRRRTQTAMAKITDSLIRLLAPILPYTAEEAWEACQAARPGSAPAPAPAPGSVTGNVPGNAGSGTARPPAGDAGGRPASVHLQRLPQPAQVPAIDPAWSLVMTQRERWLKRIEEARQSLGLDNPMDCGLELPRSQTELSAFDPVDLADLCSISRVTLTDTTEPKVLDLRQAPRCERSWKRDGTVKERADGGMLSDRDAAAVGA